LAILLLIAEVTVQFCDVVASKALALPGEAISSHQETASAKTESASQRHIHNENC